LQTDKFTDIEGAENAIARISKELGAPDFTIVRNPSYVYRPFDVYIMAPAVKTPRKKLYAIVKDMDGTTTTTEELCVHSLEFMVGKISGREAGKGWKGLEQADHSHIVGNSTTKHIEYLINKYGKDIEPKAFRESYFRAVLWTLSAGKDPGRKEEILANLSNFGLSNLLLQPDVTSFIKDGSFDEIRIEKIMDSIINLYPAMPVLEAFEDQVRAAIDVYYQRYHEILAAIDQGTGEAICRTILPDAGSHLIEPMPGVAYFLATVKGWLGEDLSLFGEELKELIRIKEKANVTEEEIAEGISYLSSLGRYFEKNPLRVSIVTSSIAYEARIVLSEVFKVLYQEAESWPIKEERKKIILEHFSDYRKTYDAFITASDSSEIRLKPHPDLYSLALHRMGVSKANFDSVIGFEDSESGTRAIRTAGIGLCVALPFPFTEGHDLSAASHILDGGLPEAILKYSLFLDRSIL
jgi:phosphoglycolate phosphatase-like HAD superfamily hydrolase